MKAISVFPGKAGKRTSGRDTKAVAREDGVILRDFSLEGSCA
jgi:hypothetical protein